MLDEASYLERPLMQDPAFAKALAICGTPSVTLPDGHLILKRRVLGVQVAMLPRAMPPPDLLDQLREVGLDRAPLILSPETPAILPRALSLARSRDIALLDLSGGNATCRARLHPKWRNQLVGVEKRPVHVTHGPLSTTTHHPLLALEREQARSRGYGAWPAALTHAFAQAAPQQTHLFSAGYQGRAVAHMLFLSHGSRATYHIGHITSQGKKLGAHNLLLWKASRVLASQGHRTLDLGVLSPRTVGLNRFKLRTGAQRVQTGGTWFYWRPFSRGSLL